MIKISSPDIREEDLGPLLEVIRSGQLVQAGEVAGFEDMLAEFAGVPHAVAVSSGTAALHLTLMALGLGPGDLVLVPAFTFPATANVVEAVGAACVFCDVHPDTYVMTPELVRETLEGCPPGRVKAVMVVHEFGYPAAAAELAQLAAEENLVLVEDAACALGTRIGAHHPGHHGRAACVSFHPRKAITTGEGGAVLTRDGELADRLRRLRSHGMERLPDGTVGFSLAGLNYRMTEFQAVLGRQQLPRFGAELEARDAFARRYQAAFDRLDQLRPPRPAPGHSWQSYMVVLAPSQSRRDIMSAMLARGIQTTIGAQALNCLDYFADRYGLKAEAFPVATELYRRGLVLPMYGKLTAGDIDRIAEVLVGRLGA
ncbi:MAG: DegT/DnrJ/EryC1/StrS family aminotransferase [Acidimicrobiia bacterium]